MTGWKRVPLGEIASITKGVSYKSSELRDTGRVMVNLKNVAKGGGFRPEGNKFFAGEAQGDRVLRGGDLLIAYTDLTKEREILGCPVMVPSTPEYVGAVFSMDLGRISPDPNVLSTEFLAYWLQSPQARAYMRSNASGATVMHLRTASVPAMEIPLPPLEEQQRIVAKLDEVGGLTKALEEDVVRQQAAFQACFRQWKQSVFDSLCSESPMVYLGDIALLDSGFAFPSRGFTEDSRGVRLLGGESILPGHIRWASGKRWPATNMDGYERFALRDGDLVVAMDRPWISSGLKLATVTAADLPSLLIQRTARVRPSADMDPAFLRFLLDVPAFTDYLLSVQTGVAVPHISLKQLAAYRVPVPPLGVQSSVGRARLELDALMYRGVELGHRKRALAKKLSVCALGEAIRGAS